MNLVHFESCAIERRASSFNYGQQELINYSHLEVVVVVVVVKLYLNTLPSSPMDVFHEGRHTNYI
jgi:hypothetical protein